jgi:hypothetical protein
MVKGFATLVTGQRGMDPKSLLTFHIDLPQSLPLPRVKAFRTTYSNNCRHFKESVPLRWRAAFRKHGSSPSSLLSLPNFPITSQLSSASASWAVNFAMKPVIVLKKAFF